MTENCIFLQKYLVMSKKSSTFARFFVRTDYKDVAQWSKIVNRKSSNR